MLCDPWIETLLKHKFINLEDFVSKQKFFLHLFRQVCFKFHMEVVGYSSLKINKTWKNVRTIKE
jgi:hypothetical protein